MAFVDREITDSSISKDMLVKFYFLHTNQQMPHFLLSLSLHQRQQKQRQLLGRLQDLLLGPKADEQTTCEVLDYFLRRLSSSQVASRVLAMKVHYKRQDTH